MEFGGKPGSGTGVLIDGKAGQPIVAAASGRVVYAGGGLIGYGQLIILKHNDTYLSAYGHNAKLLVKEGQAVKKGQQHSDDGGGAGTHSRVCISKSGETASRLDPRRVFASALTRLRH